jgi:hypothetical protein
LTEETGSRATTVTHLEQVAGERGAVIERLEGELSEKSEVLERYIQESAQMARMIVESENEKEAWKKNRVKAAIKEVVRGNAHETGEHQHINYTLRGITHMGRTFTKLDVRIVEHRGNPGILIFEPDPKSEEFFRWDINGEENGRKYTLIVPKDKKTTINLRNKSNECKILLKDIISYILIQIESGRDKYNRNWEQTCKNLERELVAKKAIYSN